MNHDVSTGLTPKFSYLHDIVPIWRGNVNRQMEPTSRILPVQGVVLLWRPPLSVTRFRADWIPAESNFVALQTLPLLTIVGNLLFLRTTTLSAFIEGVGSAAA